MHSYLCSGHLLSSVCWLEWDWFIKLFTRPRYSEDSSSGCNWGLMETDCWQETRVQEKNRWSMISSDDDTNDYVSEGRWTIGWECRDHRETIKKSQISGCIPRSLHHHHDLRQLRRRQLLFLQPLPLEWSHCGWPGVPLVHLDHGSESGNINTESTEELRVKKENHSSHFFVRLIHSFVTFITR